MTTEPLVIRSDNNGLATLKLNRPDKLNALTPGSFVALREHVDAIAVDESIRCECYAVLEDRSARDTIWRPSPLANALRAETSSPRRSTRWNNFRSQQSPASMVIVSRAV